MSPMKVKKDLLQHFGDALRQARLKANLTQDEAADLAGVARSKWSYYEWGRKNLSLLTAERLAIAVGVDLAKLIRRPRR